MLDYFPILTVEGIAWCLQDYGATDKKDRNYPDARTDYMEVQYLFLHGLGNVPALDRNERLELFRYVFGETYDPSRRFPFLIGEESEHRSFELHANNFFQSGCGSEVYGWLKRVDYDEPLWVGLLDFFFSLIPHVDVQIFNRQMEESGLVYLEKRVRLDLTQSRLRKIMTWCFDYPDPTKGAPAGESRRRYLAEFRTRMDSLENYPGELGQVWNAIKQEYR
ncbi:hypothetical protein D9M71_626140 [compost metagenome]